jgi:hypothetical protein
VAKSESEFKEPYGKDLLTTSEVAKFFRVHPRTVAKWGRKKWLTQVKVPSAIGGIKYIGTEVQALYDQLKKPAEEY